jgi:hypothetical protein
MGHCLTSFANQLLRKGSKKDGDDIVFIGGDFDGDWLEDVSSAWSISLRFFS